LVRVFIGDHLAQTRIAQAELGKAELVALTITSLCELVWVLSQGYKIPLAEIAAFVRQLINAGNVAVNRPMAEAGLSILDAGGDFADGVIAYEGNWLGAETFVSFDKKAVRLLRELGGSARLLA
jgi:predicted nucleic-acid-binding protein